MTNPEQLPNHDIDVVPMYRVENPNIKGTPDGVTSHEELVGQWFSPNLATATNYLRKATQTFGPNAHVVDGARLVVTEVPASELEGFHVANHAIAASMDVENDNYIIPRDGTYPTTTMPLDEVLGDLRGHMGNVAKLLEAKRRVASSLGGLMLHKNDIER